MLVRLYAGTKARGSGLPLGPTSSCKTAAVRCKFFMSIYTRSASRDCGDVFACVRRCGMVSGCHCRHMVACVRQNAGSLLKHELQLL